VLITTVVARNYLPQARVLARSFLDHHPRGRVVVLVLDAPGDGLRSDEPFEVLAPDDLFPPSQRRELRRMMAIYQVVELATALKPFLLRHLVVDRGEPSATYLDPDIAVFAPLDDIAAAAVDNGVVLTPHRLTAVPDDGFQPDEQVFAQCGAYNLGFVAVSAAALPFVDWWARRCRRDCVEAMPEGLFVDQRWAELGAAYFPPFVLRDPGCNVAYWNLDERPLTRGAGAGGGLRAGDAPLRFLHLSGYDPGEPHLLSRWFAGHPRVLLSASPVLRELCDDYGRRLHDEGWDECSKLSYGLDQAANGMRLDTLMRRVLRQEVLRRERGLEPDAGSVDDLPDPYEPGEATAFVDLLRTPFPGADAPRIPRYLHALRNARPDLLATFSDLTGAAGNHFLWWVREMGHASLGLPPELIPRVEDGESDGDGAGDDAAPPSRPGVRLVGYLAAELGVGEAGRTMAATLGALGEEVELVTETGTSSRQRHVEPASSSATAPRAAAGPAAGLDVNLVAVNADRLPAVLDRLGGSFTRGRHTIGMWAWEVEHFPDQFAAAAALVDEVWAISRHAADAIARKVDVPVHSVPPPVVDRAPSPRSRRELGLPDGFVFLFCFDYFSVAARKNPVGLVEAFRRAFAPGEGPRLVVKSINGHRMLADLERVHHAAVGRPDIEVVDRYLDAADQRALIASCDAYVSLHRAEGFGYTMAEAMLAGRPVIATCYSGNLEFMDEANSFLVGYEPAAIPERCDPYPAGSTWAEPDLDEAAALMRLVVDDPARARAVGERARDDIRRFHSPEARVPLVAARLAAVRSARADRAATVARASRSDAAALRRMARAGLRPAVRAGRRLLG
jgi:glycosyltransferase involved in cell wall biosynthesis